MRMVYLYIYRVWHSWWWVLSFLRQFFRLGQLTVVQYLIEVQGCSAGCTDNNGQTPLHHACGWVCLVYYNVLHMVSMIMRPWESITWCTSLIPRLFWGRGRVWYMLAHIYSIKTHGHMDKLHVFIMILHACIYTRISDVILLKGFLGLRPIIEILLLPCCFVKHKFTAAASCMNKVSCRQ